MHSHASTQRLRPLPDRFWEKVNRADGDGCWMWTAALDQNGYGRIRIGGATGRPVQAQRVAWELTYGPIPDGLWVLHHCDVPACVNPAHLWLGTRHDNIRDMYDKGRYGRRRNPYHGQAHPNAKLTDSQVKELRLRYQTGTVFQRELAKEYGVSQSLISYLVQRKHWQHLD